MFPFLRAKRLPGLPDCTGNMAQSGNIVRFLGVQDAHSNFHAHSLPETKRILKLLLLDAPEQLSGQMLLKMAKINHCENAVNEGQIDHG